MMMKQILNHKGKILSAAAIAGVVILYGLFYKPTSKTITQTQYDYYTGFEQGEHIEVTYIHTDKTLTADTLELSENTQIESQDNLTGLTYVLQNKQGKFIDIAALATNNNLNITASGLSAGTKIAATFRTQDTPQLIPTDWAGRIELSMPLNQETFSFCLHLTTASDTQMICHNQNKKVVTS